WASIALAVWLLIVPVAWIALVYVFPLWLIAVSALLGRRRPSAVRNALLRPCCEVAVGRAVRSAGRDQGRRPLGDRDLHPQRPRPSRERQQREPGGDPR